MRKNYTLALLFSVTLVLATGFAFAQSASRGSPDNQKHYQTTKSYDGFYSIEATAPEVSQFRDEMFTIPGNYRAHDVSATVAVKHVTVHRINGQWSFLTTDKSLRKKITWLTDKDLMAPANDYKLKPYVYYPPSKGKYDKRPAKRVYNKRKPPHYKTDALITSREHINT